MGFKPQQASNPRERRGLVTIYPGFLTMISPDFRMWGCCLTLDGAHDLPHAAALTSSLFGSLQGRDSCSQPVEATLHTPNRISVPATHRFRVPSELEGRQIYPVRSIGGWMLSRPYPQ